MSEARTAVPADRARALVQLVCGALLLAACADTHEHDAQEDVPHGSWPDPLAGLPRGAEHHAQLCSRSGDDVVRELFCAPSPPRLQALQDLQAALHVDSGSVTGLSGLSGGNATALSITGHSTALAVRSVSAINPRLIAMHARIDPLRPPSELMFTALAFARGEQLVELVVRDRTSHEYRFYALSFRQACNDAAGGCRPGDLLTPAIERDWLDVALYDERDLQNTTLDCAPCHQPGGPGTPKQLIMQELNQPWTHWFSQNGDGGRALLADYLAAKGDEPFAGMSRAQIEASDPNALNVLMLAVFPSVPGSFDSQLIEQEVQQSALARGGNQPFDNTVSGESATWRAAYERSQRGGGPALPYHDVKVSDPRKLATLTAAYAAYRRGDLAQHALPDLRDVFPDDWQRRAELGFATEPGLDGRGVLLQACALCHNERLDPALSRARFRADLVGMGRAQKDLAIERLRLPPSDPRAMPPARLRELSPQARANAIEALR